MPTKLQRFTIQLEDDVAEKVKALADADVACVILFNGLATGKATDAGYSRQGRVRVRKCPTHSPSVS